MLDDLQDTVDTLKKRIKDNREHIQDSEWRTRITLINPVLHALGWDVSNPEIIEIEPRVSIETTNRWADYALLGNNRQTILFLEAKKLADRDAHVWQTVSYAVQENIARQSKVHYCACTNGDVWRVYDVFSQELVMHVSLASEDIAKCSLKLLSLWRRSFGDGLLDHALPPVYEPELPLPPPPPPPPPPPDWTPLTGEFATIGSPAPIMVRLPNGQEIATKYWINVLIETTQWLHQTGMLTSENCRMSMSDVMQTKAYLLSPDGQAYGTGIS